MPKERFTPSESGSEATSNPAELSPLERMAQSIQEKEGCDRETALEIARLSMKSHRHEARQLKGTHRTEALERQNPDLR